MVISHQYYTCTLNMSETLTKNLLWQLVLDIRTPFNGTGRPVDLQNRGLNFESRTASTSAHFGHLSPLSAELIHS